MTATLSSSNPSRASIYKYAMRFKPPLDACAPRRSARAVFAEGEFMATWTERNSRAPWSFKASLQRARLPSLQRQSFSTLRF